MARGDEQIKTQMLQMGFTGKWNPTADPLLLEKGDYSDLQNFQYKDRGIKGVSGYTRINNIVWTEQASGFGTSDIYEVAYNGTDLWVAAGSDSKVATSPDGVTWTQRDVTAIFGASDLIHALAYGNGKWVIASNSLGKIATSTDGITWTERTPPSSMAYFDAAYGDGIFILVGSGVKIQTSTDGITWIDRTSPVTSFAQSVGYDSGNDLWLIGGYGGKIYSSSDGITWALVSSAFLSNSVDTLVSNQVDLWFGGGTVGIGTSPDGITWTLRSAILVRCIAYNKVINLWVSVGDNGMKSSTDGITWATEAGVLANRSIANNQENLWVAVGDAGVIFTGFLPGSN